jgi:hypothetical protein
LRAARPVFVFARANATFTTGTKQREKKIGDSGNGCHNHIAND